MTAEKTKLPYQERMDNWIIEQHSDCANFKRAKEWALANGYVLHKDVSYNGFIELRKEFNTSEDPHDGNRLEIEVWANEYAGDKYHSLEQCDMEIDFEDNRIMAPMKYRYKNQHGLDKNTSSLDLEEVFAFAEKREQILKAEFAEFLKNNPTTEWKLTDPDNFQFGRLNRGTPEFKEFDRVGCIGLFQSLKCAPNHDKLMAYIKDDLFNKDFCWIQKQIPKGFYKDEFVDEVAKTYYKDLTDLKQTCGDNWEFILAECIFEQTNGLY